MRSIFRRDLFGVLYFVYDILGQKLKFPNVTKHKNVDITDIYN